MFVLVVLYVVGLDVVGFVVEMFYLFNFVLCNVLSLYFLMKVLLRSSHNNLTSNT